mmetsp:Transcript_10128/g.18969  ORF Transcript_10128/g.18969 Transcript_10128/m.18969 type:complete len:165 (+) Transcript_10128:4027-4521(+)
MHTIATGQIMMDGIDQYIEEDGDQSVVDQLSISENRGHGLCLELEKEDQIHSENVTLEQNTETSSNEGLNEESFDDEELPLHDAHEYIKDHHHDNDDDDDLTEPELPNDSSDFDNSELVESSPEVSSSMLQKRRVPFRSFRKKVSKITGIHGFFAKPTSKIGKS